MEEPKGSKSEARVSQHPGMVYLEKSQYKVTHVVHHVLVGRDNHMNLPCCLNKDEVVEENSLNVFVRRAMFKFKKDADAERFDCQVGHLYDYWMNILDADGFFDDKNSETGNKCKNDFVPKIIGLIFEWGFERLPMWLFKVLEDLNGAGYIHGWFEEIEESVASNVHLIGYPYHHVSCQREHKKQKKILVNCQAQGCSARLTPRFMIHCPLCLDAIACSKDCLVNALRTTHTDCNRIFPLLADSDDEDDPRGYSWANYPYEASDRRSLGKDASLFVGADNCPTFPQRNWHNTIWPCYDNEPAKDFDQGA